MGASDFMDRLGLELELALYRKSNVMLKMDCVDNEISCSHYLQATCLQ